MNQIKFFFFLLFLNSCSFGYLNNTVNTSYNLASVGDSTNPSSSEYFYFDVDTSKYRSERQLVPSYEISTTEEYGDSANRDSVSNCEILHIAEEEGDLSVSEPSETLVCILDILEGTIRVKDLHLTFNFPEGMCNYVQTGLPWHFNHAILPGPVVQELTCGENAAEGCVTRYRDTNNNNILEEEENLCPGEVKCCYGGSKVNDDKWEPEMECFGGPALVTQGYEISHEEFYKLLVRELPEGGLKGTFTIPNGIDLTGGSSSLTHANYTKKLDRSAEDIQDLDRNDLPVFLQRSSSGYPYSPRLFYEFNCLDEGYDSLHKILVLIREWNTLEEFVDFYTVGGADGIDPDVDGIEGTDCKYEDRSILKGEITGSERCNDLWDMDDIVKDSDEYKEFLKAFGLEGSYPQISYDGEN